MKNFKNLKDISNYIEDEFSGEGSLRKVIEFKIKGKVFKVKIDTDGDYLDIRASHEGQYIYTFTNSTGDWDFFEKVDSLLDRINNFIK